MAPALPTLEDIPILLIHGSFQLPSVYQRLINSLRARNHPTLMPIHPSCSNTSAPDFPSKTLLDDTDGVKTAVEKLVKDEGRTVVLVMHSYGGLVGSNAVDEELSFSWRRDAGLEGGVLHLFYFAAFILDKGQSVVGVFGESNVNEVTEDGRFCLREGAAKLYNDLPAEEAAEWEARMIPQSYAVKKTEMERTAYKYIPSTYLICEEDKAVAPQYQEMFAKAAGAKVVRCNAGHSPMLSQPEMLVDKIETAIKGALGEIK